MKRIAHAVRTVRPYRCIGVLLRLVILPLPAKIRWAIPLVQMGVQTSALSLPEVVPLCAIEQLLRSFMFQIIKKKTHPAALLHPFRTTPQIVKS